MRNLSAHCYLSALKPMKTVFLLFALIWPINANAGFVTGFIVGSMLSSHEEQEIIHEIGSSVSYDEELYQEYTRNKELMHKVDLIQKEELKLRNRQIEKILVNQAIQQYIAGFSVKLTPVEQKIVERVTISNDSLIDKFNHLFSTKGKKDKQPTEATRKHILYKLIFTKESPSPVNDFEVLSINNEPPIEKNGDYYFNYNERWGFNNFTVKVRKKNHQDLAFELTDHYYVDSPQDLKKALIESKSLDLTLLNGMMLICMLLFVIKLPFILK